jgi:hypothetical protein
MCGVATDLRQHLEPLVDRRLLVEHVERGAAHLAGLDGVGQRASSIRSPRAVLTIG